MINAFQMSRERDGFCMKMLFRNGQELSWNDWIIQMESQDALRHHTWHNYKRIALKILATEQDTAEQFKYAVPSSNMKTNLLHISIGEMKSGLCLR